MGKNRNRKPRPKGEFTDSLGRRLIRCQNCNGFAPHNGDPLCGVCSRKKNTRSQVNLIRAIMDSNDSLTYDQARQLASMIENHGKQGSDKPAPVPGSNLKERAAICGEYKLTFGQWSGNKLKDVSPDYIIWLSDLEESRKHSIDFLNAIRAARTIRLSWQEEIATKDVPFDAD
jgi:hypothetical protein